MWTGVIEIWMDVIRGQNKALDAAPRIASSLKSMLVGRGPVNATVRGQSLRAPRRKRFRMGTYLVAELRVAYLS